MAKTDGSDGENLGARGTNPGTPGENRGPDRSDSSQPDETGGNSMSVGEWKERCVVVRRVFPGPRVVDVPLRIAFERAAYAEIVAHAKDSLEAEICGVLIGSPCQDEEGDFVHVAAVIQGAHAAEGSRHVTFTQETWNGIHAAMERDHPRLQIVGWYHSHPGFGVEFSEMDLFIQKNFFAGAMQIGLVIDPLGGDVAICMNADDKTRYVPKFWIDAREHKCRMPARAAAATGEQAVCGDVAADAVAALETRIGQLIATVDDMRRTLYRWIYALGMLLGLAIILFISLQVSTLLFGEIPTPPSRISFATIPLRIDGQPCLLGVSVVTWKIPPELIYTLPSEDEKEGTQEADKQKTLGADVKTASPASQTGREPARSPPGVPTAEKGSTP